MSDGIEVLSTQQAIQQIADDFQDYIKDMLDLDHSHHTLSAEKTFSQADVAQAWLCGAFGALAECRKFDDNIGLVEMSLKALTDALIGDE